MELNVLHTVIFTARIKLLKYGFHQNMILLDCKKATVLISTLHTHYLKHNVQMIEFFSFKMITFFSFQAAILKFFIF